jgi:hypothetical protein
VYSRHTERARKRLEAQSQKTVAAAKQDQGLTLTPHKLQDWEIQMEKDRMLDELQDLIGDVRRILKGKGSVQTRVQSAIVRLGEVEE